ncbi:hypothetical protein ACFL3G_03395 [Planctomycetota bacterium]
MTKKIHVWPKEPIEDDGYITVSAIIEGPESDCERFWYRLPAEFSCCMAKDSDVFLLGTIFKAMRNSADLVIHGQVSATLLRNLVEFQSVWNSWRCDRYTVIDITVESERKQTQYGRGDTAVSAFSGGVDSCFTIFRHSNGTCGRLKENIEAAMLVHGFDIPIEEKDAFERTAVNSKRIVESLGKKLITISTNFRQLGDDWEDAHGAAIASALTLLSGGFSKGLIASTEPYNDLVLPWGSNPVTDFLLSSDAFSVIHDGASFNRNDKIHAILSWPEAMRYLRVCWQGHQRDRNCCQCEKCIRTILNFRSIGAGLPECFPRDVSDRQITALRGLNSVQAAYLKEILSKAKAAGIEKSWVKALEKCLKLNQSRGYSQLFSLKSKIMTRAGVGV